MPAFGTGLLFLLLACTDGGEKQETGNPETGTTDTQDTDTDTALEEDADGDGYLSYAHGGEDCDDQDATVFPGAPEVLADARDNDCDGRQDLLDFAEANARLIEQNPDEGGGYSVAGAAGFGGVGVDFLMVSAPYGKEGGDDAGTVYLDHISCGDRCQHGHSGPCAASLSCGGHGLGWDIAADHHHQCVTADHHQPTASHVDPSGYARFPDLLRRMG